MFKNTKKQKTKKKKRKKGRFQEKEKKKKPKDLLQRGLRLTQRERQKFT